MRDNIEVIVSDIRKRGYSAFEDIIARKDAEKFFVDFKTTHTNDYTNQRTLYDSDRNNFAKALSGFGNSEGGIIIWGINASGSINDYAKTLIPIKGIDNFKTLLESFVSILTVPVHKTTESFIIKKNNNDSAGFAVTVIPKSNDRPFQTVGDYKYYMRAGDSFVQIPHGVLQGMFGKQPQPNVFWMFNINRAFKIQSDNTMKVQVGLMAVNGGLGIAEDIYGFSRAWGPGENSQISAELTDLAHYDFQKSYGLEFSFMSKQGFRLGYEQRSQMMVMTLELLPPFTKELYIELLIGARNQQVYRKVIQNTPEKLLNIYKRFIKKPDSEYVQELWNLNNKKTERNE